MAEIEVGKFTLESLTTGMYSEPESCYREYIQNAVDSLDSALEQGILAADDFRIEIIIDADRQEVSIKDNGTGVAKEQVPRILLDIGNSTKRHSSSRGFRGIGRLGGLSYCSKLSFCTTTQGEAEKTLVTFDCNKLKELLVPGKNTEYNLQRVISEVTDIRYFPEQASAHYFIVKMEGIDEISSLLDIDAIKPYISQVAPLPYKKQFYWQTEIKENCTNAGVAISEYPIFIGRSFESLSQLYKPYRSSFRADKGKFNDTIQGLSYFRIDYKDELMAFGWYANTSFAGTLEDDTLSGIRIKKGNIQIGDERTVAPYFKEHRFNGWSIGEIFIVCNELIPNARRDDFERNAAFECFVDGLRKTIGTEITDKIRAASKLRNNPVTKILNEVKQGTAKAEDILSSGFFSSHEKEQVAIDIDKTRKKLYQIPSTAPKDVIEQKQELMSRLTYIATQVDESRNFKAKNDITSNFSKAEKKIIQYLLEVLSHYFDRDTVDMLYTELLDELKGGKK